MRERRARDAQTQRRQRGAGGDGGEDAVQHELFFFVFLFFCLGVEGVCLSVSCVCAAEPPPAPKHHTTPPPAKRATTARTHPGVEFLHRLLVVPRRVLDRRVHARHEQQARPEAAPNVVGAVVVVDALLEERGGREGLGGRAFLCKGLDMPRRGPPNTKHTSSHLAQQRVRDERRGGDHDERLHLWQLVEAGAGQHHEQLEADDAEVGVVRGRGEEVARHRVEVAVADRLGSLFGGFCVVLGVCLGRECFGRTARTARRSMAKSTGAHHAERRAHEEQRDHDGKAHVRQVRHRQAVFCLFVCFLCVRCGVSKRKKRGRRRRF